MDDYYERSRKPLFTIPKHPLGRLGCGLVLVGWFLLLLLPCAMIWLAVGNTITVPNNNLPEPEQHPAFQVQLLMEAKNRGLLIHTSGIANQSDEQLCIANSVNYLLWESDRTASDTQYCQCYTRPSVESAWEYSEQYEGLCNP